MLVSSCLGRQFPFFTPVFLRLTSKVTQAAAHFALHSGWAVAVYSMRLGFRSQARRFHLSLPVYRFEKAPVL